MTDYSHLPENVRPGSRFVIGSYTFREDEILRFARAWDPQPFHTDKEAAKGSILGGLCASGWHTVSVWMKLQRKYTAETFEAFSKSGNPLPEFGPSPGMSHVKWMKPVMVNDTITYENEIVAMRHSNSKPGWSLMSSRVHATNHNGEKVMQFDSAVFIRV